MSNFEYPHEDIEELFRRHVSVYKKNTLINAPEPRSPVIHNYTSHDVEYKIHDKEEK